LFALLLLIPALLFVFRVLAQFIQLQSHVSWLPEFSSWASGILSYDWLLALQVLIFIAMAFAIVRLASGRVPRNLPVGRVIRIIGLIYFSIMLFRLIAGMAWLSEWHWFAASIPALFHLVLACFLILLGQLHVHHHNREEVS